MRWVIVAFAFSLLSFSVQVNASEYPADYPYASKAEVKQMGSELTEKLLSYRETAFEWWLMGIAILVTFAGIAIAVSAFFIGMNFRDMRAEAKQYLEEIKKGRDYADQMIGDIKKIRDEIYEFKL
ncbi:MAG: hypothetical protein OXG62_13830 [Nitrospinae bacterium]|nr:hypothetical protein [Nitrospinota bacterium]